MPNATDKTNTFCEAYSMSSQMDKRFVNNNRFCMAKEAKCSQATTNIDASDSDRLRNIIGACAWVCVCVWNKKKIDQVQVAISSVWFWIVLN